ncbi:MAG: hypothetical protein S4CHLAM45_00530 [Chlamydiales bacterium]|nr:hypothetical protein [Chlamydiales bacterium]MCH9619375.1 hypothetical protein [Chlamydiales bacterium]MCH9622179.1 hypothetical protein [Chlamydiales bacterium]
MSFYADYYWRNGTPYGIGEGKTYRIVSDPYRKWISIEKYRGTHLIEVVYDSHLLDFRLLKPLNQLGWRKEPIIESNQLVKQWIFNEDDRAILIEEMLYEKGYCRRCRTLYPCGRLLSEHLLSYKALSDSFNGMTLYDANAHPVMQRIYDDFQHGEWIDLQEERWSLKDHPTLHRSA